MIWKLDTIGTFKLGIVWPTAMSSMAFLNDGKDIIF